MSSMQKIINPVDDNGFPIEEGDVLRSNCNYSVIAKLNKDKKSLTLPYGWYGQLICPDTHSCKNIPYSIEDGKQHKIIAKTIEKQIELFERADGCGKNSGRVPGTSLTRILSEKAGLRWSLGIGRMNDVKKWFYGKTITEVLRMAKKHYSKKRKSII